MCIISAVLLVLSLYKTSSIFIDKNEAKYVAIVASLLPSIYLTIYVYGQLPTIFSSAFSLLTAYAFYNYLTNGKKKDLAYTALLSALTALSHNFTFLFFPPILLLLTLIMSCIKHKVPHHRTIP